MSTPDIWEATPGFDTLPEDGKQFLRALSQDYDWKNLTDRLASLVIAQQFARVQEIHRQIEADGLSKQNGSRYYAHPLLTEQRHLQNHVAAYLSGLEGSTVSAAVADLKVLAAASVRSKGTPNHRENGRKGGLTRAHGKAV